VTPERVFGKPNPEMLLPSLRKHGVAPKDAVVIGDRLYTDIAMASATGCASVLVLSGETTRAQVEYADQQPDLVVASVAALA
jgi:ribonucleotide monophosphatase NagD (HAD superfamily)